MSEKDEGGCLEAFCAMLEIAVFIVVMWWAYRLVTSIERIERHLGIEAEEETGK